MDIPCRALRLGIYVIGAIVRRENRGSIWGQGISLFVRGDQGTGTQCVVKGLTVDMSAGFCWGGGVVGGGAIDLITSG